MSSILSAIQDLLNSGSYRGVMAVCEKIDSSSQGFFRTDMTSIFDRIKKTASIGYFIQLGPNYKLRHFFKGKSYSKQ